MENQHQSWLSILAAAKQGGVILNSVPITRGKEWAAKVEFEADYAADSFFGSLGLEPNDGASELADFAIEVSIPEAGKTRVVFSLSSSQTEAITSDSDGDGVVWCLWEIYRQPAGGSPYRKIAGSVPVLGSVSND